ncbi:MAG: helix-turn-helix transcriptional regulator [bacterium]|nr:helix-turn-helix transcriptional regulator [bacterium]
MKVNEKIRELRKQADLTQVELAERSGVGVRFMRELERGKPTVRTDKVKQVLDFFGYHLEAERDEREKI